MQTGTRAALDALAAEWRTPLDEERASKLVQFAELLMVWNARINLTGARTVDDLIAEHLPDAFAVAGAIDGPAEVVDVGSGGGLPALPLAILRPDLRLTLVEPLSKKVAFLRTATRELGLPSASVSAQATRRGAPPGAYDVAISRATFVPAEWADRRPPVGPPERGASSSSRFPGTDLPGRRTNYLGNRRTLIEVRREERST